MTTRSHSTLQEAAGAIMVDPALAGLRTMRTVMLVCIALCILSSVVLLVISRFGLHLLLSPPFNPFSLAGYFTISLIMVLIQIRFRKRLEQRRQRAAKGDASLLAVEQPAPNIMALPLSITIGQRPKWGTLLLLPGIFVALILYELSSAHDIVRWVWMRRRNRRVIFISQPTSSAEEYERQMQALLPLIAARTGLPLYDLR